MNLSKEFCLRITNEVNTILSIKKDVCIKLINYCKIYEDCKFINVILKLFQLLCY